MQRVAERKRHCGRGPPRYVAADLLSLVHDELRGLAAAHLSGEKPGNTLDPTALVHEAYLRLTAGQAFESQSHFLRVAAGVMWPLLVDHARARAAAKRGGRQRRVPLDQEPRKAKLVALRCFGGTSGPEAAAALGVAPATAIRWWAYARTWLFAQRTDGNPGGPVSRFPRRFRFLG